MRLAPPILFLVTLTLTIASPNRARGEIVYSNFGPNDGFQTNMGDAISGPNIPSDYQAVAAAFTPASTVQLGKV